MSKRYLLHLCSVPEGSCTRKPGQARAPTQWSSRSLQLTAGVLSSQRCNTSEGDCHLDHTAALFLAKLAPQLELQLWHASEIRSPFRLCSWALAKAHPWVI